MSLLKKYRFHFLALVCASLALVAWFGLTAYSIHSVQKDVESLQQELGALPKQIFGASGVVAKYRTTLATPGITSTDTTIPVSSITLRTGETIESSDLIYPVYLTINSGGSSSGSTEEDVECWGFTTTTPAFTFCGRAISSKGGTATSTVSGKNYPHAAGESVIMADVPFFFNRFVDLSSGSQTISGNKTFTGEANFTASTTMQVPNILRVGDAAAGNKSIFAWNADSNRPFIRYDDSNNYWILSDDGTNTYRAASSTSITGGQGILVTASVASVATSTFSGLKFVNEGGTFKLTGATSSNSGGNGLVIDSTGGWRLNVDTSNGLQYNSAGQLAFGGNFSNLVLSGALTATSTSATSSFANVTLGDLTGNVIIPDWAASSTNTSATGTFTGNLQINGSINATGINYIGPQVVIGTFTKTLTAGGNTTSTHNLGVTPRTAEVYCAGPNDSTGAHFISSGFATGVGNDMAIASTEDGTNGQAVTDSSNIVRAINDVTYSAGSGVGGNLTILNSTVMEITWTVTNSISETMQCMYKVSR